MVAGEILVEEEKRARVSTTFCRVFGAVTFPGQLCGTIFA